MCLICGVVQNVIVIWYRSRRILNFVYFMHAVYVWKCGVRNNNIIVSCLSVLLNNLTCVCCGEQLANETNTATQFAYLWLPGVWKQKSSYDLIHMQDFLRFNRLRRCFFNFKGSGNIHLQLWKIHTNVI